MRYLVSLGIASFFVLVGTLFYWLAALGTPIGKSIWYLRVIGTGSSPVYFGNFGWCAGTSNELCYRHVGYEWIPYIPGGYNLTGSLMIVALTAAIGTITLFILSGSIRNLGLGICAFFMTIFTSVLSTLGLILALAAFVTAHRRFENDGFSTRYGPAFILLIIGWLSFLVALPFIIISWFAVKRARRDGVVHHETKSTTTTTTRRRRFF